MDSPISDNSPNPSGARCPGPSTRDIILADGDRVPAALLAESNESLGDEDIAFDRYTSPAMFDREIEKLWPRVWQWACREEHLPEVGDTLVYDIGRYSILLVRTAPDRIKAYHNSCLHRGTQLRPSGSIGAASELRCPFHGWSWTLEGQLKNIPCRWDFPHVSDEAFALPEVRVETWGGFVFINMDSAATPLTAYLGVLPEHFAAGWDPARRVIALHIEKILPTNWKAAQEAFLEAYHVLETHAQALITASDANAQYDVFGEHVSRFIHTIGVSSPHYTGEASEQAIFDAMRLGEGRPPLAEGQSARAAAAGILRETLGTAWGIDLTGTSTSEMLDSIEYHAFPNMCLFPGVSLPLVYRFRPRGMDHSQTIFDLLLLRPLAPGEVAPFPPDPVKLTVEQGYAEGGMNPGLAHVFDQDTSNLAMQYRGFQASQKPGQTLGNYQESRIRHFHQTLDQYLDG